MKFTIINYVWHALYLLIVRLSISPVKLTQKLTAAITEKKTNSKSFFQGRCFHKNTSQKTFWEVKVSIQNLFWSIFCLRKLQPWSKRLGTLKKMRRENTPCLLKVYLTCYKCLEMLLKEPVSAVPPSPQQCWLCWKRFEAVTSTLNRGGRGERKYVIFTSCLVNVPRVLARVVVSFALFLR